MIVMVNGRTRQWWVNCVHDFYYRTRRDAIHRRNGISGMRMRLSGRR